MFLRLSFVLVCFCFGFCWCDGGGLGGSVALCPPLSSGKWKGRLCLGERLVGQWPCALH